MSESPIAVSPSFTTALYWRVMDPASRMRRRFYEWLMNLALRRLTPDSVGVAHAERELKAIGYDLDQKEEDPNKWICENVIQLLRVFSTQGHSGASAPFAVGYFTKLAAFEPLSPLTGEEWEWQEHSAGKFQNTRCPHVFKDGDDAYDINGKVFREPDGCCYTSGDSRVPVEFPYTPKTEYVDVEPLR